jgi:hypothetical protein
MLSALGLNPDALQAVREEQTPSLPGVAWNRLGGRRGDPVH